jgi:hypothetical protein
MNSNQAGVNFRAETVNPLLLDEMELIQFFMGDNTPVEVLHAVKSHQFEDNE